MLPHYQNRTLNYENRIKEQVNKRLKKKYANLAPVNFTAVNTDAQNVFDNLEKTLFLIFALLQESQTYLFQVSNHSSDIGEMRDDYTVPSNISYNNEDDVFSDGFSDDSSFDRNSQFQARQDPDYEYDDDSLSSFRGNNITTAQKVVSTIGQFRSVLSRLLQTAPTFNKLVKQITPLFGFLSQLQVDSLRELMGSIIDLFQELSFRVTNELNETGRDKDELLKVVGLISDNVIGNNFTLLANLIQTYNPIVLPAKISSINDTLDGYSLSEGIDVGLYV